MKKMNLNRKQSPKRSNSASWAPQDAPALLLGGVHRFRYLGSLLVGLVFSLPLTLSVAVAGVFNIPHFIASGEYGFGLEPELNMTGTAATGLNLRYTQGVSDLSNITGIIGTGAGQRGFRAGVAYTFDIFPDIESQPGIGVAIQPLFIQVADAGTLELTGSPYVHKAFRLEDFGTDIDPFLAIPIGMAFAQGNYKVIAGFVVGAMVQHNAHLSSVLEFGINVSHANTYISGGVIYYH